MGALKSALEQAGPRYKEWLSRYEAQWKYEPIIDWRARNDAESTGEPVRPHGPVFYGTDLPEGIRVTLTREVILPENGRSLARNSEDENVALTAGLAARFKAWSAYRESIARFELDTSDPDFQWQQDKLDDVERIMQGYVNLICAVNFDFRNEEGPQNLERVEKFLDEEKTAIIAAFENNGGRQAFLAKTLGLPSSSRAGREIYDNLSAQDLGIQAADR